MPIPLAPAAVEQPLAPAAADAGLQLRQAEFLITRNEGDKARDILKDLSSRQASLSRAEANQLEFLLGLLDIADKDYEGAIHHFHRILINDPRAVRVRLELGRAYFLAKDYNDAEREFLYARAGKIPRAVQLNIDHYLNAIRSLRTFSYSFAFSFAADSDENAGPATDTISLYGLPFQLSQQAKANAGVGFAFDGGLEVAPRLDGDFKWRIGAQIHRSQYLDTLYDDMTLSTYTGPHLTWKRWDFDLLGNVGRRWYGDRVYTDMVGGLANATYYVTTRLGVGGSFSVTNFAYPQTRADDGTGGTVAANVFYTPTTASIIRAQVSYGRQGAYDQTWANHAQQYSLSYTREFKAGITFSLSPAYTHIAYDAPLAAFGATRVDHQYSAQATLLDRKIDWHGLTPRLAYSYTYNDSTVRLYAFHRSRVEVGITRAF